MSLQKKNLLEIFIQRNRKKNKIINPSKLPIRKIIFFTKKQKPKIKIKIFSINISDCVLFFTKIVAITLKNTPIELKKKLTTQTFHLLNFT